MVHICVTNDVYKISSFTCTNELLQKQICINLESRWSDILDVQMVLYLIEKSRAHIMPCQTLLMLTHKWLEMHGCIINTVATDDLVLKYQVISSHNADKIFIELHQFHTKIHSLWKTLENKITFSKKHIQLLKC